VREGRALAVFEEMLWATICFARFSIFPNAVLSLGRLTTGGHHLSLQLLA
jgi:hypothetical protein